MLPSGYHGRNAAWSRASAGRTLLPLHLSPTEPQLPAQAVLLKSSPQTAQDEKHLAAVPLPIHPEEP